MAGEKPRNDNSPIESLGGAHPDRNHTAPAGWASALGAVIFLLGILLTASHGNEWMKQAVIAASAPAGQQLPAADCPADELEEEGLSLAECEHLLSRVRGFVLSAPDWFPRFQIALSALGTFIAAGSILVGTALVNARSWAPRAATVILALLIAIDLLAFIAAVNAGPIIRGEYLWGILVWFVLHVIMTAGVIAGRHSEHTAEVLAGR